MGYPQIIQVILSIDHFCIYIYVCIYIEIETHGLGILHLKNPVSEYNIRITRYDMVQPGKAPDLGSLVA